MLRIFSLLGCQGSVHDDAVPVDPVENSLRVLTPDANWKLRILRIVEQPKALLVVADLKRDAGAGTQSLHEAVAALPDDLPAKKMRVVIFGKSWRWRNNETYEFLTDARQLPPVAGKEIFRAPDPAAVTDR